MIALNRFRQRVRGWEFRLISDYSAHIKDSSIGIVLSSANGAIFLASWILLTNAKPPSDAASLHDIVVLTVWVAMLAGAGFVFGSVASVSPAGTKLREKVILGAAISSFGFLLAAGFFFSMLAVQVFKASIP